MRSARLRTREGAPGAEAAQSAMVEHCRRSRKSSACEGSPRGRRAVGVGDVAGERGDRARGLGCLLAWRLRRVGGFHDPHIVVVTLEDGVGHGHDDVLANYDAGTSLGGAGQRRGGDRARRPGVPGGSIPSPWSRESGVEIESALYEVFTLRDGKVLRIVSTEIGPRPSKPPGCRSSRCRRRTWRSFAEASKRSTPVISTGIAPSSSIWRSDGARRRKTPTRQPTGSWGRTGVTSSSGWRASRAACQRRGIHRRWRRPGPHVESLHRTGPESGVPADWHLAIIFTLRDGRIVRGEEYFDPAEASKPPGCRSRRLNTRTSRC